MIVLFEILCSAFLMSSRLAHSSQNGKILSSVRHSKNQNQFGRRSNVHLPSFYENFIHFERSDAPCHYLRNLYVLLADVRIFFEKLGLSSDPDVTSFSGMDERLSSSELKAPSKVLICFYAFLHFV